ncbi:MAG: hypothetical protein GWO20_05745 [Candidatus Korarchaeota archaeon]|nr:hypothetical protein [Candidatus Korarchaeota archaeon]NIU82958.1 hypothetical protein [Candidatus Thorarchaeota archaeon]NIW13381.1 hypothetical protein [Candidatus Thorarchaeota archaeon]NIW51481.1 hypothetical protein [Candidatus Korarchaeota archaeon]
MEDKSEGMEKLENLIRWSKRKKLVKTLLRGCRSIFFLAMIAFFLVLSLEKGIEGLFSFLRSFFLQFTIVDGLSFLLTILGHLTLIFLLGSVVITGIGWYVGKKVKEIEGDGIII